MRALSLNGADLAELSAGVLGRGGAFRFRARGTSMVPFLRDGDMLTVEPVEATALRLGDVVLYRVAREQLAAHRLVARRADGEGVVWVARGDAATGPGELVRAERVLGRVVRVQRGKRTLDLERGGWRTAARLWVATAPLGPWLLGAGSRGKRLGVRFLHRLQRQGPRGSIVSDL
jgi:hypothetical protein